MLFRQRPERGEEAPAMHVSGRWVPGRETPPMLLSLALGLHSHWGWGRPDAVLDSFQRGLVSAHTSLPGPPILPVDTPGLGLAPAVSFSGPACCVCSVPITVLRVLLPQSSEAPACLWPLQGPISRSGLFLVPSTLSFLPGQLPPPLLCLLLLLQVSAQPSSPLSLPP